MVDLSIVILSYNTSEKTINCINSLVKKYYHQLEKKEYEIVVLDNNSSDDSVKKISDFLQNHKSLRIQFIQGRENLGFGGGNNLAATKAAGTYLLFLNSDTIVLDTGIIGMIDFMSKEPHVGVLGGKLYNNDGSIQKSVGTFYTVPTLFLSLFGGGRLGLTRQSPNLIKEVDWVSGALCMVRKNIFEKIKGFDKDIFMYVEDMDLCYRIKRLGYKVMFYPNVEVKHSEIGSSNRTFAITSIYKGTLVFFRKHKSKAEYQIAAIFLKTKAYFAIILGTILGNSYLSQTYREALQSMYE